MNLYHSTLKVLLLSLLLFNCNAQKNKPKTQTSRLIEQDWFDGETLLKRLEILSSDEFEGRRTGTKGAEKAKDFIINKFKSIGIEPLVPNYTQSFSFKSRSKTYQGKNVLGRITGTKFPEKYIVITAHYDHEGIKNGEIYNGADDDASGVSALIAFANYLKRNPPNYSVILAAVDAEELGLKGSEFFVSHSIIPLKSIKLNLNMDMIGRSETSELFAVGTNFYPELLPAIPKENLGLQLITGKHDGIGRGANWTNSSDHASFHNENIPFLYFGVADHKDYHKPTDDFEAIDPIFYQNAVYTILSTFRNLDALSL